MSIRDDALAGRPLSIGIIDAHAHLGAYASIRAGAPTAADMVRSMDALGVSTCAISSFLALGPDLNAGNNEAAVAISAFPGRFVGYAVVNPRYPELVIPELERCFDVLGMVAIKLHPPFLGFSIADPACERVFEFADDRGCAVLSHDFGGAEFMARTARKYPRMRLMQAHVSYDGFSPQLEELFEVARALDNVYLDVVFSAAPFGGIERTVAAAGEDRVLYGSDSPMFAMSFQAGKVMLADLDDSTKIKLLRSNAERFFGMRE